MDSGLAVPARMTASEFVRASLRPRLGIRHPQAVRGTDRNTCGAQEGQDLSLGFGTRSEAGPNGGKEGSNAAHIGARYQQRQVNSIASRSTESPLGTGVGGRHSKRVAPSHFEAGESSAGQTRRRDERDEIISRKVGAEVHNRLVTDGQNGNIP